MKRFLGGLVAAAILAAVPAQAFEFGFEGAKSATAAELEAETGVATKYPQWVQGRVEAGQREWLEDYCGSYIEKMSLAAFTNAQRCVSTHYRINGQKNPNLLVPGDVWWLVDLGSDPAAVQAAFTAAAKAEAKAAADAQIAPFRDALLGNEEFRAEIMALVDTSAEGVNEWVSPEELSGLRAELFAELEKLGDGNVSEESLRTLIGTLLDERGYVAANIEESVKKALADSGLSERLTAVEKRVTDVEGSLANLTTAVDEQGKAIANLTTREDVGAIAEAAVGNIVDARIASVNAADRNWLYALTAFLALAFLAMGFGYYRRRSRWQRLAAVEEKATTALAISQDGLVSGDLPDFQAMADGTEVEISVFDRAGQEVRLTLRRVPTVSNDDKRPGLLVTGVAGQNNAIPIDAEVNMRLLRLLTKARRDGRLNGRAPMAAFAHKAA